MTNAGSAQDKLLIRKLAAKEGLTFRETEEGFYFYKVEPEGVFFVAHVYVMPHLRRTQASITLGEKIDAHAVIDNCVKVRGLVKVNVLDNASASKRLKLYLNRGFLITGLKGDFLHFEKFVGVANG